MAITTLVLENNASKDERHAILLNAVREHFNNPDIDIEYSPKGKPKLVGANRFISVACVDNVMLCAISDSPVGIDGEHITKYSGENRTDYAAMAERFFTEEEADYVRGGDDTGVRFVKVWIRKEAYCKFTGKGISDFSSFSVSDGERFYGKVNGTSFKRLQANFPGSNEYLFMAAEE